jgi:hypothetical protein
MAALKRFGYGLFVVVILFLVAKQLAENPTGIPTAIGIAAAISVTIAVLYGIRVKWKKPY